MFSELDEKRWPHHIDDFSAENAARLLCKTEKNFKIPNYDERLAIRHHRMTIALAMPERGKHGL